MLPDHVAKRETAAGRRLPALFYALNFALWIVTGVAAQAWGPLWLAVLPLIALAVYLARVRAEA